MRNGIKAVGVLFVAASSVYAAQVSGPNPGDPAVPATPAIPASELPAGVSPADIAKSLFGGTVPGGAPAAGDVIPVETPKDKAPPLREGQPVRAGQVNVSEAGTVDIHVVDANLLEVLRMLASQSQRNIIASKDVRGAVTANLYDVTIREALDAILQSNGFAYREKGNFIYVYTAKEIAEIEKASRKVRTEVFRVYYTPAANAVNMVKPVLSTEAQVSFTTPAVSGIGTGTSDVGGNSHATDDIIVVTDFPENLDKVREVLKEIDKRPQQVLVEATILRASLTDDNALGVDFNVLAGVNFASVTGLLNGSQINNAVPGEGATVGPLSRGVGSVGTGNNFSQGINNGLRVGFVSDNISVFLAALEGVTDTTVLANPKILALNKQKGEVIVGRKDGYLTTTVTSSSSTQTVEFLDTGTRLIFRPYIGDDGYIRMEIHPEDSSGGLTANANLPFKITTEVTTNVMVKDGNTVIIGGLFRESSDTSRNQVPILGSIPVAGTLFRNQRDRTVREEIIILLTPHIIKDESAYTKDSLAAEKDWGKLRVGVRKGMMISGRERLAESSYEKALAELNKPNPDRAKALWHLDIATNLNPKFAEAVALKEKISGVELSVSDSSSVKGFLRRRVLAEEGMAPTTQPSSYRIPEPEVKKDEQHTGDSLTMVQPGDGKRERRTESKTSGSWSGMFAKFLASGKHSTPTPTPTPTPAVAREPEVASAGPEATPAQVPETPTEAPTTQPSLVATPATRPSITVIELPERP
jgi:type IV pilus assembly protein PilQ